MTRLTFKTKKFEIDLQTNAQLKMQYTQKIKNSTKNGVFLPKMNIAFLTVDSFIGRFYFFCFQNEGGN